MAFLTSISALFKKLTDLSRPIDVSRLLRFLSLLQVILDLTSGLQVFIPNSFSACALAILSRSDMTHNQ